jgi:hypothetical protein
MESIRFVGGRQTTSNLGTIGVRGDWRCRRKEVVGSKPVIVDKLFELVSIYITS